MRHLLLLLLAACTADKSSSGGKDSSAADTSTDTDTGTDSGTPVPQTGEISGTIRLPEGAPSVVGDLKLGLVGILYGSGPDLADTVVVTEIETSGTYTLALSERPPESLITELEPSNLPGLMGAVFLPIAFIDADQDDRFIPGDQIAGGTLDRVAVWLEGDIPEGYAHGWNVIDTGLSGTYETGNCLLDTTTPLLWRAAFNSSYPVIYGLDEPVDIDLFGLEADLSIAGTVTGLPEGAAMALLPYQTLFNTEKDPLPQLAPLPVDNGVFSASFAGPPDEALDISPDPSWGYAIAYGIMYEDADGSGDYSAGEGASDASFCVGNSVAGLRYTWPVASYRGWRLMECYSVHAGWRVVTRDSTGVWVSVRSDAEAASIVVDSSVCSF